MPVLTVEYYQKRKRTKGGIQMKRLIAVLLTLALIMTAFTGMAFADKGNGNGNGYGQLKKLAFRDIEGHWSMNSIMKMQNLGILQGYEDGTFRPERILTMAELAVIIDKLVGERLDTTLDDDEGDDDDKDFNKVPGWAKNAAKKGFKHGYLNLKRFNSHVQVNRLLACVAIANATMDGVVLFPSAFGITTGSPPSRTETQEFVVPKSIPITFPISFPPIKSLLIREILSYTHWSVSVVVMRNLIQPLLPWMGV
jgi:hypothetical protein